MEMEDRLKRLIEANNKDNRMKWTQHWQQNGKKVLGIMSSYVPEEVISAAGILPWRLTGTFEDDANQALLHRGDASCGYCSHVLESYIQGEFDFLDGIVATDLDQDLLRTWEVMVSLNRLPYYYAMHAPFVDSEINYHYMKDEIGRLIKSLEEYTGTQISETALREQIDIYNKMRSLISRVYELRKRVVPPLSGAETLGITAAARIMPKDEFNWELESLLPYLEKRETKLKQMHPRLMISSEMLDNPAYMNLIEEGCLVAMDDMETGSRYFVQNVDTTLGDPAYALAKRYLSRHGAPRMSNWEKQLDQITEWVKEYEIDGVLVFPLAWCYQHSYRMPFLSPKLKAAGIPNVLITHDYNFTNIGQLRTRIGAFIEMVSTK
ncbi:2-hydroxyacyl-CoA dehydratase subunit D [Thermodesulfobacteriota bacterium]